MRKAKEKQPYSRLFVAFIAGMLACAGLFTLPDLARASEGVPAANCVVDVGDGKSGDDAKVDHFWYPGQQYSIGGGNDSWFINCNARNFLINDGTEFHLDGSHIGDRFKPLEATTPSGVKFYISLGMYWTLNQNFDALMEFWSVCLKYQCATPEAFDPNAENFSAPGWNGFLGENVSYALWGSARIASQSLTDDIWDKETVEQYDLLASQMVANFNNELRFKLGFVNDIMCGSNTSQWQDPNNPGAEGNVFNCAPVRIEIYDIKVAPDSEQGPSGLKVLNQARHEAAEILYGDNTDEVLGQLDQIKGCVTAGAYCSINFEVPDNQATMPEPTATPEP